MDGLVNVFLVAASSFALTRNWFQGSIFALRLETAKAWRGAGGPLGLLGELLTCPLCLSSQLCILLTLLFLLPAEFLASPWAGVVKLPLYALAASALVPWRKAGE